MNQPDKPSQILMDVSSNLQARGGCSFDYRTEIVTYNAIGYLASVTDGLNSDGNLRIDMHEFMTKTFGIDKKIMFICPGCKRTMDIANVLIHMNDQHEYSFTAIADYLKENGY